MSSQLSSEEIAVAKKAAKRYGLVRPSFMDVIDELTPQYANGTTTACSNTPVIRRWHRVSAYAMELVKLCQKVNVRYCVVCNREIMNAQHNAKYCSPECNEEYFKDVMPECARSGCSNPVKRKGNQTCSRACKADMARGNRWSRGK